MRGGQRLARCQRAGRVKSAVSAAMLLSFAELAGAAAALSPAAAAGTAGMAGAKGAAGAEGTAGASAVPAASLANPELATSLTDLGAALLRQTQAVNGVVSPVAAAVALGLVQAGANGPAEREIEALFGPRAQGSRALRQGLPSLLRQMQGEPREASPLALASRMWVDTSATVPGAYAQRLASRWQADALRLPFSQSEAARAQINHWTAERTAGRIKDLLPPGSITSATKMALTSAVHFRSPWEKPFDAAKTAPRAFKTAAGESKPVPTMVDERSVMQARIDGHLVMEIPFAPLGGRPGFALLVAVPEEGAAMAAPAVAAMAAMAATGATGVTGATGASGASSATGAQMARWRAALAPIKCELSLPSFAIAPVSGSLKSALQGLCVKTVFTDRADLRPMLGRVPNGCTWTTCTRPPASRWTSAAGKRWRLPQPRSPANRWRCRCRSARSTVPSALRWCTSPAARRCSWAEWAILR